MSISIDVLIPANRAGRAERRFARATPQMIKRVLEHTGKDTVRFLRQLTVRKKKRDTGRLRSGWRSRRLGRKGIRIWNARRYAIFVEKGRRPGRPPPARALRGWAARRLGDPNAAFPVARNIGKRGIPPTPILTSPEAQRFIRRTLKKNLRRELNRALRRSYR